MKLYAKRLNVRFPKDYHKIQSGGCQASFPHTFFILLKSVNFCRLLIDIFIRNYASSKLGVRDMNILSTHAMRSAYQSPVLSSSTNNKSSDEFEVISFESVLSHSDKRTLAAMDEFAKNNGISEKEMFRIKNAIAAEKLFAQKEGREIPNIDKKMMTEIYAGALAGRTTVNSDSAGLYCLISINFKE